VRTSFRGWLDRHPQARSRYRRLRGLGDPPPRTARAPRAAAPTSRDFGLRVPDREGGIATLSISVAPGFFVGKVLQRDGLASYETEALACFVALTDIAGPGPVWDVGANIGVYSLLARSATDRDVVAFEPTPDVAAAARSVHDGNGLPCEIRQTALADHPGTATLYLSSTTDSSNSLREGFRTATGTVEVPMETLDDLVESGHEAPAVLKIDTETTEPAVLRGALRTIARTRPWIMCEILPGRTEAELTEVLAPLGYTWYLITEKTPFEAVDVLAGDRVQYMWLFAPTPAPDELWTRIAHWRSVLAQCTPIEVEGSAR
jgi:FkbM family methyltransferase